MEVGRADVLRMAALARIALSDDEAARLRRDLQDILDHVDALPDVSAGAVAPGPTSPATRPDDPGADALAGGLESFAPEAREGLITVPRLESHADAEPG